MGDKTMIPDNAAGSGKVSNTPWDRPSLDRDFKAVMAFIEKARYRAHPTAAIMALQRIHVVALEAVEKRELRKRIDEHMGSMQPTPFGQHPPVLDPDALVFETGEKRTTCPNCKYRFKPGAK
jgi:hypothetical protein